MTFDGWLRDARRIAVLAWPVLIGQLAVLAFGLIDTALVARRSATDLAALAVGGAAYVSVFIGLMGVVLAVAPLAGQSFGAHRLHDAGRQFQQAMWLALGLSVFGCTLLLFPQPFLAVSQAPPGVAVKVRAYLAALAVALPPALLFTAFRAFNSAVSRPRAVMHLQLGALLVKLPLSALLVFGASGSTPFGAWTVPALGAPGCGIATAAAMVLQAAAAAVLLRRDPFYRPFGVGTGALPRPDRKCLAELLRLGMPMGLSIGVEVTGFTFMALLIARLGPTPVAGHQLAVNLVSLLFMVPLSLGSATGTLVAQRIGAADPRDARRLGWHGLQLALAIAALTGGTVYLLRVQILSGYTSDARILSAALPLLGWVMLFHVADAAQALAAATLRAYRVTTAPLVIYAVAIWGVGLAGGYLLAFDVAGITPDALGGARGFWAAATCGLTLAAIGLVSVLAWMLRHPRHPRHQRHPRQVAGKPAPLAGGGGGGPVAAATAALSQPAVTP